MDPKLSVVIVNWNTKALLSRCLQSLQQALGDRDAQILVVDNGSTDGSVIALRSRYPDVEVIASEKNLGFAAANNLALQRAEGHYVLFLNPDTEITAGAVDVMVELLDRCPNIGIVGTTLLNPDGSLQLSCRPFYGFWSSLKHNRLVDRFVSHPDGVALHRSAEPVDVDWMTGACLTARKTALDSVGAFDTDYFLYGEEIDLQYRMHQAGWRVVYVSSTGVIHHCGQSARQTASAASLHDYRGRWLFLCKHYPFFSRAAYFSKTIIALAFWMAVWGILEIAGSTEGSEQQRHAYWRLLTWHLFDRSVPPIPALQMPIPLEAQRKQDLAGLDPHRQYRVPAEDVEL